MKKLKYPNVLTISPEYPPINLGKNNINEVNNAYCDVVKWVLVSELRKATNATEAMPADTLSATMTNIKYIISGSKLDNRAKRRLVAAARMAPKSNIK